MIKPLKIVKYTAMSLLLLLLAGLLWPENLSIPVKGATNNDWNHQTFWYEPWGSSGVHKGIDIFGKTGTEVIASTGGIVVFSGQLPKGGNAIAVLGPKWRIHYFAHLNTRLVSAGTMVAQNEQIGTLGDTGNAKGKQPHVHYSIVSIVPIPWRLSMQTQGWKRMFFLNPHDKLL